MSYALYSTVRGRFYEVLYREKLAEKVRLSYLDMFSNGEGHPVTEKRGQVSLEVLCFPKRQFCVTRSLTREESSPLRKR